MKQILSFSKWPSAMILAGIMIFTSCKKDATNTTAAANTADSLSAVDAVQSDAGAEAQYNDVFDITMGVQPSDVGQSIGIGSGVGTIYRTAGTAGVDSAAVRCFTVTVVPSTPGVFPKVVTINFGTGCLGKDGKLRSGEIVSVYTGPMFIPGNSVTNTFVNYNVDSFQIAGTHTITNISTTGKIGWTVKVVDGEITNTISGKWRKWDCAREHDLIVGNDTTLNPLTAEFQITGGANGSNSNGNSWTSTITTPLLRSLICPWIGSGDVTITRNSSANSAVLDFGNGTCDNLATITYKGITRTITLRL